MKNLLIANVTALALSVAAFQASGVLSLDSGMIKASRASSCENEAMFEILDDSFGYTKLSLNDRASYKDVVYKMLSANNMTMKQSCDALEYQMNMGVING